jgi:hypothetical protein
MSMSTLSLSPVRPSRNDCLTAPDCARRRPVDRIEHTFNSFNFRGDGAFLQGAKLRLPFFEPAIQPI